MMNVQVSKTIRVALRHASWLALPVVLAVTASCVETYDACEEYGRFKEVYSSSCPEVESWSTNCATSLEEMTPVVHQDFDWCVDCMRLKGTDDPTRDCNAAPLGEQCAELLNRTLDASCF